MKTFRIFLIFLRLGLTSFGGPVAHIGYFRKEFVEKRHWLGDAAFADLLALCQFLPGPSSSQMGISLGLGRGAWRARLQGGRTLGLFDSFFRAGSLVFGGGHVVLPLLREALVAPGWIADDKFLSGYALAQTVPGPLFTFAAYVGGVVTGGWTGAALCTVGIFLPSFLMLFGVLPFWHRLSLFVPVRRALAGVNAAVVGLLLAALYDPVFTSSVHAAADFVVAVLLFLLLKTGRVPVPLLVAASALAGFVI